MSKKEFDWGKFDAILQFYPTKETCAEIMEVSEDTVERRIKEKFNSNFSDYRDRKMGRTRVALAKKAVKMALDGNATMLIFCLKNLCGWADKMDHGLSDLKTIVLKYNLLDDNEDSKHIKDVN
jgi:hypothetical protein